VANNIKCLGGTPIIVSMIGNDYHGDQLKSLLLQNGILIDYIDSDKSRTTTVKTRVQANKQQLLRFDNENIEALSPSCAYRLLANVDKILKTQHIDAVVFEDYNKGVLTECVIESIQALCKKKSIQVFVDPKKNNFFTYKGMALFKPNLKEFCEAMEIDMVGEIDESQLNNQAANLKNLIDFDTLLVTLGSKGIFYYDEEESFILPIPSLDNIVDVSGAGDTVISIACLTTIKGFSAYDVVAYCNAGANLVCQKNGVSTISSKDLFDYAAKWLSKPIDVVNAPSKKPEFIS
jgi:rfaE bifunctional protein kinase chain/domain